MLRKTMKPLTVMPLSFWTFLALAGLASVAPFVCGKRHVTFVYNKEKNVIEPHDVVLELNNGRNAPTPPGWMVDVQYIDSINETGWSTLEFTMNPDMSAEWLAYAAGYAEGFLTKTRISQHWNNTVRGYCDDAVMTKFCKKLYDFLQQNLDWMKTMIEKNPKHPYWGAVKNVLLQVQGVVDGYESSVVFSPTIRLKPFGLLLMQLGGDLEDLEEALNAEKPFFSHPLRSGSCSAFIKLTKDENGHEDLFAAQATWGPYEDMLRIAKRLNFPDHTEVFSGYPGSIFSEDDYYILSSGLVTMETTNGNGNPKLWSYVQPESVLEWIRNVVSNRLAKSGSEWCKIFELYNSGTYNNQWMIVDYKKFEFQEEKDILWVLEQLPSMIRYDDVTKVLRDQTYWGSYNVPYFEEIFNASGQPEMVKKYGDWFTHDKNPRAKIFARDHKRVTDMDSLIKLMRYNDFKNDPLSRCNCTPPYSSENTIAARSDLNDPNGVYPFDALAQRDHGATDFKATNSILRKTFGMMAECGPTHDQQPVFQWSTSPYSSKSHEGHPDRFDFKPELIAWGK